MRFDTVDLNVQALSTEYSGLKPGLRRSLKRHLFPSIAALRLSTKLSTPPSYCILVPGYFF